MLLLGDRLAAEDLAQEDPGAGVSRLGSGPHPGVARRVGSSSGVQPRGVAPAARPRARRALDRVAGRPPSLPADDADAVAVRDAILLLPERERRALVLRFFADLSVRDTAAAMSVPEGTVKTLTRSAIAALRASGLVTSIDHEAETSNATGHQ